MNTNIVEIEWGTVIPVVSEGKASRKLVKTNSTQLYQVIDIENKKTILCGVHFGSLHELYEQISITFSGQQENIGLVLGAAAQSCPFSAVSECVTYYKEVVSLLNNSIDFMREEHFEYPLLISNSGNLFSLPYECSNYGLYKATFFQRVEQQSKKLAMEPTHKNYNVMVTLVYAAVADFNCQILIHDMKEYGVEKLMELGEQKRHWILVNNYEKAAFYRSLERKCDENIQVQSDFNAVSSGIYRQDDKTLRFIYFGENSFVAEIKKKLSSAELATSRLL